MTYQPSPIAGGHPLDACRFWLAQAKRARLRGGRFGRAEAADCLWFATTTRLGPDAPARYEIGRNGRLVFHDHRTRRAH